MLYKIFLFYFLSTALDEHVISNNRTARGCNVSEFPSKWLDQRSLGFFGIVIAVPLTILHLARSLSAFCFKCFTPASEPAHIHPHSINLSGLTLCAAQSEMGEGEREWNQLNLPVTQAS